jgi:hypothetical protein
LREKIFLRLVNDFNKSLTFRYIALCIQGRIFATQSNTKPMKKIALAISALALVFAVSTTSVAQNAPAKQETKKEATTKKDGKCCTSEKAAAETKKDCATPCSTEKKACCSSKKAETAKPVPAPESK